MTMALLHGQRLTRTDLMRRCGDLSQIAGIRLMTLTEGAEAGVRVADVRTGSGLRFQVTLDRGMDISMAEYQGMPLAWRSPHGDVHPAHFDPRGKGWLRTFPGGLVTGCGMTYLGAPCVDEGVDLGLHGRLSHLQATEVSASHRWEADECIFTLRGSVRENVLFGEHLLLHRSIEVLLGGSEISIHDTIVNQGSERTPFMMLYHVNPGWPLIDAGARLLLHARGTTPRDPVASEGLGSARVFSAPVKGFHEQVFSHDLVPAADGFATALVHNPALHRALAVRFRQRELPRFIEWKMMGEGEYVVGLEPANCGVKGRAEERRAGTLQFLLPGERKELHLLVTVLDGEGNIAEFVARNTLS
jgi:hypothetical protein